MAVRRVEDSEALAVAASVNFPALPDSGTRLEYNNKRYLLAIRDGKYIAWDISVYSDSGKLLSGSWDVWINAAGEVVTESGKEIKDLFIFGFGAYVLISIIRLFKK